MVGLPNSKVIPPDWEAHHAPTCDASMTATITVTRLSAPTGTPTFDAQTGRSVYPTPTTVWSGACRIQQRNAGLGGTVAQQVGEKAQPTHYYLLATSLTAPLLDVNDVAEVTSAVDAAMVGRTLRITDVLGGSTLWQRDYHAEEWVGTAR